MKKKYCTFGIIVSAAVILLGILTLAGVFGGDTGTASGASYFYDSGYATFGADFYTYVTNNAEEAASASRTAANNLHRIAILLKNVLGCGMIAFGLLCICGFKIVMADCKKAEPITENPVTSEAPIPEPIDEIIQNTEAVAIDEETPPQES